MKKRPRNLKNFKVFKKYRYVYIGSTFLKFIQGLFWGIIFQGGDADDGINENNGIMNRH